jgi:hypothetical protein
MRLVATGGIIGIAVVLGAVLVGQDGAGWIVGLAVGLTPVVLAALLWSSRQLCRTSRRRVRRNDQRNSGARHGGLPRAQLDQAIAFAYENRGAVAVQEGVRPDVPALRVSVDWSPRPQRCSGTSGLRAKPRAVRLALRRRAREFGGDRQIGM